MSDTRYETTSERPRVRPAPPHVPGGVMADVGIGDAQRDADGALTALVSAGVLHAEELALAATMSPARRAAFVAGRRALRAAVTGVDEARADGPFLRNPRGRPVLPAGVTGSVSHKRSRAVALAARRQPGTTAHVGIDLEARPTERDLERPSIAARILTAREFDAAATWAAGDRLRHRERTLLYFALKEAVYKTIDPWVERYVRFTEVELDIDDERGSRGDERAGVAAVRLLLPEADTGGVAAGVSVRARWELEGAWIVATAISTRP